MRLWNLGLFIPYAQRPAECLAASQWTEMNGSTDSSARCFLGQLHLHIKQKKQGALGPECLKPELPRNQTGNGIKCRVLQFISPLLVLNVKLGQPNVSSTWEKAGNFTSKWPSSHPIATNPNWQRRVQASVVSPEILSLVVHDSYSQGDLSLFCPHGHHGSLLAEPLIFVLDQRAGMTDKGHWEKSGLPLPLVDQLRMIYFMGASARLIKLATRRMEIISLLLTHGNHQASLPQASVCTCFVFIYLVFLSCYSSLQCIAVLCLMLFIEHL